jgi:hypothetical protein
MLTMLNQQEVARGGNKAYGRPTTGGAPKGDFLFTHNTPRFGIFYVNKKRLPISLSDANVSWHVGDQVIKRFLLT